ncbi:MAG: GTPase [Scrofimicrobium sp.]
MARPTLDARVQALRVAIDACEDRLPAEDLRQAQEALSRAEERSQMSAEHTVVALAGSTGAGKSAIFNQLVGADIAVTGRQRPTTAYPMAVVAESGDIAAGSDALLEWLGVQERYDVPVTREHPSGLILLDLPDHDSVVAEHRLRADRVTERADLLIWVANPQKYADGVLHNEYLSELIGHDEAVVVLLNQIDRLEASQARAVVADLERLVRADGLKARVLGTSAITGQGLDEVQSLISRAVTKREAAVARKAADVRAAGQRLLDSMPREVTSDAELKKARAALMATLDDAAGIPLVVEAVKKSAVRDAVGKTGWPPVRWIRKLRTDPLRALGLRGGSAVRSRSADSASGTSQASTATSAMGKQSGSLRRGSGFVFDSAGESGSKAVPPTRRPLGSLPGSGVLSSGAVRHSSLDGVNAGSGELVRSSLPTASPAVKARVASATRAYVEVASRSLPPLSSEGLNARAVAAAGSIPDDLDRAVVRTVQVKQPVWWRAADFLQWVFLAVAVAGGLWLAGIALMEYLRMPTEGLIPTLEVRGFVMPWPTLLLLAGIAAGLLLALISRLFAQVGANRRANRIGKQLRASVEAVAEAQILGEVSAELERMTTASRAAKIAAE